MGVREFVAGLVDDAVADAKRLPAALERIKELEADLAASEEERLQAQETAGNLQLRLDESLAREGALNIRLSNLDILAREITAKVEKMTSAIDK